MIKKFYGVVRLIFSPLTDFFLVRFWAFLDKGNSKTRLKKSRHRTCTKSQIRPNKVRTYIGFIFFSFSAAPWQLASGSSRPGTAPEPRNKGPGMGQPRDSPGTSRNKLFFPLPPLCVRQVPRNTPGRPSKYQARPGELPNDPPGGASPPCGPGYGRAA